MDVIKIRVPAEAVDGFPTRFAPGAFDGQIGREVTVSTPVGRRPGILAAAVVAEDGRSAELTFDLPVPEGGDESLRGISFEFRAE